MTLHDIIMPESVACDLRVTSKKQLFQEMAQLILASDKAVSAQTDCRKIVAAAQERERLGSTGVGSGVALPHARVPGIDKVIAAFARLETPLDYEAIDERPVDLVAMIIAPEDANGEHLRALAQLSRRLRKMDIRARLRGAPDAVSLYMSLADDREASAA